MTNKILTKPINNKESLIEEPTIDNILAHSTNDNLKESLIDDTLKQSKINNILKEPTINNKESLINNTLKQSMVDNFLKEPAANNKESSINDVLNENTTNNLEEPKMLNNLEEPKINNNLEELKINNLEEPKINKKPIINKESDFVKTPECIRSKRAILYPQNNDNKSFQYSITLSLYHEQIGKNHSRVSNISPYTENFNWENINFPPTEQDYQQFEMNNTSIPLNILTINDQEEIKSFYKSQYNKDREKQVNLLLLENKHYTSVKNLKFLLS